MLNLQHVIALMQPLNDELLKSINTYFNALSNLGYVNYTEVNKLIVALFLNEILDGIFDVTINNKDFRAITDALNCLYGHSCILPFPGLTREINTKIPLNPLYPRITEQSVFRNTEAGKMRSIE